MTGPSILVVDDNRDLLEGLVEYLGYSGYSTLAAGNGAEGLRIMEEHHVDLVITDLFMPAMDGFEFTCQIRTDGNPLPVIVFSATPQPETRAQALAAGADAFIAKPAAMEELLKTIENLLGHE